MGSENHSHSNDGHKKPVSKIKMVKKNYQVHLELDTVKYDDVEVQKPTGTLSRKKSIKKSFFQSIIHSLVMKDSSVTRESTSEVSTEDANVEVPLTFFDRSETTKSNTQSTTDSKISIKYGNDSTSDEEDKNYTSSGSSVNSDDSDTSAEEESLPIKKNDPEVGLENIDLN